MSGESQYAKCVTQVAIAKICATLGWTAVNTSSLDILTDLLRLFIRKIGTSSLRKAELCNRTLANVSDVGWALSQFGFSTDDLLEYLSIDFNGQTPPLSIPKFPKEAPSDLNFLNPNSKEKLIRKEYIYDYLPPMFPQDEAREEEEEETVESKNETLESLDENSKVSIPLVATNSSTSFSEESSLRNKGGDEGYVRENCSVTLTSSGLISPARMGRLPDARSSSTVDDKTSESIKREIKFEGGQEESSGSNSKKLTAVFQKRKSKGISSSSSSSSSFPSSSSSSSSLPSSSSSSSSLPSSSLPPSLPPSLPSSHSSTSLSSSNFKKENHIDEIMDSVIERGILESQILKKKRKKTSESCFSSSLTPLTSSSSSSPPEGGGATAHPAKSINHASSNDLSAKSKKIPPPMIEVPTKGSTSKSNHKKTSSSFPSSPSKSSSSNIIQNTKTSVFSHSSLTASSSGTLLGNKNSVSPNIGPGLNKSVGAKPTPLKASKTGAQKGSGIGKTEEKLILPPPPPSLCNETSSLFGTQGGYSSHPLIPQSLYGFPVELSKKRQKDKKKHKKEKRLKEPVVFENPDKPGVAQTETTYHTPSSIPKIKIKDIKSESSSSLPFSSSSSDSHKNSQPSKLLLSKGGGASGVSEASSSSSTSTSFQTSSTSLSKKSKLDKKDFYASSSNVASSSHKPERKTHRKINKEDKKKEVGSILTETVGHYVDAEGNQIWICPACGKQDDGSAMIGCDECDDWYHWSCVGINSEPAENQDWFCTRCMAKKQGAFLEQKVKGQKKKGGH